MDINKILDYYEKDYNDLKRRAIILLLEKETLEQEIQNLRVLNGDLLRTIDKHNAEKSKDE